MSQKRSDALSIPNIITYFRLLLIPAFLVAYFEERYILSLVFLALSGLSDIADGYVARRFHMITDLGKALDPVADKLTQAAMFFCVAWNIPAVWILLGFLVVKELVMLLWSWLTLRRTGQVHSARWYGKVCTAVLYVTVVVLVLLPGLPPAAVDAVVAFCGAVMLMSLVLYSVRYLRILRQVRQEAGGRRVVETSAVRSPAFFTAALILFGVLAVCAVLAAAYGRPLSALFILLLAGAALAFALWLWKNRAVRPEMTEGSRDECSQ